MSVSLQAYAFQVKTKRHNEYHRLNELVLNSQERQHFLPAFFDSLVECNQLPEIVDAQKKTFTLKEILKNTTDTRRGYVCSGDYGYTESIVDINTNVEAFEREPHHAGIKPFYFLIGVPQNSRIGFLLIEKFKSFSPVSPFEFFLTSNFYNANNELKLEIHQAMTKAMVEALYQTNNLKKITVKGSYVPSDIADYLTSGAQSGDLTLIYEPKIKSPQPQFIDMIKNSHPDNELLIFNHPNFSQESCKVTLLIGGKEKVVDVANPLKNFRPLIDLTESLKYDPNGRATFDSIDEYAMQWYEELRRTISPNDRQN